MAQTVRKVILYFGGQDTIMDYFQIGEKIGHKTLKGQELAARLRMITGISQKEAEQTIDKLAEDSIADIRLAGAVKGVLSTEDGELWFHLINQDTNRLDLHNQESEQALLESVREWAKSDHESSYVDSLSNEEFCQLWYFQMIVTENPIEGGGLTLEEIKAQQPVGMIYDNHEKPYCLYIDGDCIDEFDFIDMARQAYHQATEDYPESTIDILSADGLYSLAGIN